MTSKFLNISNVTLMNNLPNSKSKIVLKAARLYQNVKRFRPRIIRIVRKVAKKQIPAHFIDMYVYIVLDNKWLIFLERPCAQ